MLLHGPPGTGKTLLAKAVAHETNAHFMRVVGSELVQKYIGEGARLVRELFDLAKKKAPTIIFIDEIDAVGASRTEANTSGDREVQRTLMQLLAGMDGFENRGDVKIIGATNRIDILDKALLRPGRFDRIIEIPLPDEEGRFSILKVHTRSLTIDDTVILSEDCKPDRGKERCRSPGNMHGGRDVCHQEREGLRSPVRISFLQSRKSASISTARSPMWKAGCLHNISGNPKDRYVDHVESLP